MIVILVQSAASNREVIARCAITSDNFESFLGFLKAKARFQKMIPEILTIPSKTFSEENVQLTFKILSQSDIYIGERWFRNYITIWQREYEQYLSRVKQVPQLLHVAVSNKRSISLTSIQR